MKAIIKTSFLFIFLLPGLLIFKYKKSLSEFKQFSPYASVEINFNILKDIISLINEPKATKPGIKIINLDKSSSLPFGKFIVEFNNYNYDKFIINGKVYFEFGGFSVDNNPYYIMQIKELKIRDGNTKFSVTGEQELTYLQGFYSFSDLRDDLIKLKSQIVVKYDKQEIKIVDKDVKLKAYTPVYGFRTVTSNIGEKILTFSKEINNNLAK